MAFNVSSLMRPFTLLGIGALLTGISLLGLFAVPTWIQGAVWLAGGALVVFGK